MSGAFEPGRRLTVRLTKSKQSGNADLTETGSAAFSPVTFSRGSQVAQKWLRAEVREKGEIFKNADGSSFCVFVGSFEALFDDIEEARFFVDIGGAGYTFSEPIDVSIYTSNGVIPGKMNTVRRNFRQVVALADFGQGLHEYSSAVLLRRGDVEGEETFARLEEIEADIRRLSALRETMIGKLPRINLRCCGCFDKFAQAPGEGEAPGI